MNTPATAVIIVIALILGSTLSIMNKACKSGYHAWCSPTSTERHQKSRTTAGRTPGRVRSHNDMGV
jgi:hypothetical protein